MKEERAFTYITSAILHPLQRAPPNSVARQPLSAWRRICYPVSVLFCDQHMGVWSGRRLAACRGQNGCRLGYMFERSCDMKRRAFGNQPETHLWAVKRGD